MVTLHVESGRLPALSVGAPGRSGIPPLLRDANEESPARKRPARRQIVRPVWTPGLRARIDALLETVTVPPALRLADGKRRTNKSDRLQAALQVLQELPPACSAAEAINQMACVLARVEAQAARHVRTLCPARRDGRLMRMTVPVAETVQGRPLQISYALGHVALFAENGACVVQKLPPGNLCRTDYRQRSAMAGIQLLAKPGGNGLDLWHPAQAGDLAEAGVAPQ